MAAKSSWNHPLFVWLRPLVARTATGAVVAAFAQTAWIAAAADEGKIEIRRAEPAGGARPTAPLPSKKMATTVSPVVEAKPVPSEPVSIKVVDEKPIITASLSKVPLVPPMEEELKKMEKAAPIEPPPALTPAPQLPAPAPAPAAPAAPAAPPAAEPRRMPPLLIAAAKDDVAGVRDLIGGGADPNEDSVDGDTALCAAIRQGNQAIVDLLIGAGASVSKAGRENQPPLALASLRRGPGVIRSLLAAGADPNVRFNSPVTKEVLERVVIKDLKSSLENDRGLTPLIACASRGDVEGASELMRAGAKPTLYTTRYKRYPINFAATQGYLFLMRIVLGRQPESEPEVLVTIDLSAQRAWLMQEGKIIDSCSISTGREGYATPAGRYVITDKHKSWVSTLYHVSMPYFMRLNCSAIGLHSGYVTGRPASHGCIRLPYEKAKKFFGICQVGDEVQIVH